MMGRVQVKAHVMEQQELVCALKVLKGHLIHAYVIICCFYELADKDFSNLIFFFFC
jgi:hypothetical protein